MICRRGVRVCGVRTGSGLLERLLEFSDRGLTLGCAHGEWDLSDPLRTLCDILHSKIVAHVYIMRCSSTLGETIYTLVVRGGFHGEQEVLHVVQRQFPAVDWMRRPS
jgi:hypothetical protein